MTAARTRVLALFLVLALLLTGCAGAKAQPAPDAAPPAAAAPAPAAEAAETPDAPPDAAQAAPAATDAPEASPPPAALPKICIDPGHFTGINQAPEPDSYGYCEGDFNLQVALALRRILAERYGIEACLTRDSGDITIDGRTNWALDRSLVELRGRYAAEAGCDVFISLHTNGNQDDVNDQPTWQQPAEITKTVVIVNIPCRESEQWLNVANEIGERVTAASARIGLSPNGSFYRVAADNMPTWTDEWNDSVTLPGSVFYRLADGKDYYGVLRGAADAGVPGMIIEHGFHTVAQMRYLAQNGNLAEIWAEADAEGIAAGLGLLNNER